MLFEAKSTTVYPDHTDYDRETVLTVSFPALQCVNPMPNVAPNTRVVILYSKLVLGKGTPNDSWCSSMPRASKCIRTTLTISREPRPCAVCATNDQTGTPLLRGCHSVRRQHYTDLLQTLMHTANGC